MPKLSALMFLLSMRFFLNYRSKVSQLTPLPMVPIILLRLLLVPATMERKKGPTPPLFLPAQNQETNWAGFPNILSPDATPTKLSIPYILLIPLMCFCRRGVVMSTGERWMSASSTYTKLSPTLERSLLFCYVISDMRLRMQSLIQMGLTTMELMWQVCSYCRLASSPLVPGGSSCSSAYACAMSETMNSSVSVIFTSGPRSTATRYTNSPCTPYRYPERDWRSRKETRLYMPFRDYSYRCSMQSPLRQRMASRLSPISEIRTNSLRTRSQLKTRETLILPIRTFTDCQTRWMFYSCPASMLYTVTSRPTRTFVSRRASSLQPLQFKKIVWFSRWSNQYCPRMVSYYTPSSFCNFSANYTQGDMAAIMRPLLLGAMRYNPTIPSSSLIRRIKTCESLLVTVSHSVQPLIQQQTVLQLHGRRLTAKICMCYIDRICLAPHYKLTSAYSSLLLQVTSWSNSVTMGSPLSLPSTYISLYSLAVLACSVTSLTVVIRGSSNRPFTSATLSLGSAYALFVSDYSGSVPLTKRRQVAVSMGAAMYLQSSWSRTFRSKCLVLETVIFSPGRIRNEPSTTKLSSDRLMMQYLGMIWVVKHSSSSGFLPSSSLSSMTVSQLQLTANTASTSAVWSEVSLRSVSKSEWKSMNSLEVQLFNLSSMYFSSMLSRQWAVLKQNLSLTMGAGCGRSVYPFFTCFFTTKRCWQMLVMRVGGCRVWTLTTSCTQAQRWITRCCSMFFRTCKNTLTQFSSVSLSERAVGQLVAGMQIQCVLRSPRLTRRNYRPFQWQIQRSSLGYLDQYVFQLTVIGKLRWLSRNTPGRILKTQMDKGSSFFSYFSSLLSLSFSYFYTGCSSLLVQSGCLRYLSLGVCLAISLMATFWMISCNLLV